MRLQGMVLVVGVLAALAPLARAQAGDATLVLRDGRKVVGELLSYADGQYRLRGAGGEQVIAARDVVRLELNAPGRITLQVGDAALSDVVATIARLTGRDIRAHEEMHGRRVTLDLRDAPWEQALEEVARQTGGRVELRSGALWVVHDPRRPTNTATGTLSIDVVDVELGEVLVMIARQVGTNVLAEPAIAGERVTVSLKDIPWRDAVDVLARMCRARVEERDGVIVVAAPPRVTIQFTDANVRTVLQLLAAYSGKNIVVAQDVTGTVSVDVKEMWWDQALLSVCAAGGFQAWVEGEAVIVSKRAPANGTPLQLPGRAPPREEPPQLPAEANERAAIAALRVLCAAQDIFRQLDKDRDGAPDYASSLQELGAATLIDGVLASGTKAGYVYEMAPSARSESLWLITARPEQPGASGTRYFVVNQAGVIHQATDRPFLLDPQCRIPEGATPVR